MIHNELMLRNVTIAHMQHSEPQSPRQANIDFTLQPGEWVNLVGVNGSGKSSLARLLAGLTIEGVQGTWSRGFAGLSPSPYVMQQPDAQLFAETPREEIRFALEWLGLPPQAIMEQTEVILHQTGLHPIGNAAWDTLSGGQRQLAAVAAASAARTPLLVFDEATSMLDEQSRQGVLAIARSMHENGTAIVWVTQRLQELQLQERVTAMMNGEIVFDGTAGAFLYGAGYPDSIDPTGIPPCQACGLRLPYLAQLALELGRRGKLRPPYPRTTAEWSAILLQAGCL